MMKELLKEKLLKLNKKIQLFDPVSYKVYHQHLDSLTKEQLTELKINLLLKTSNWKLFQLAVRFFGSLSITVIIWKLVIQFAKNSYKYSPDIDKVASSVGQFIMSTVILTLIVIIYWFLKFWKVSIDFKKGLMIKEYLMNNSKKLF
ncbi:hypothetical protein [Clostridium perfringens]|uniref:hypothetical protein n=1 Tax=Clostridium perfringens TaxID=1502 RepID=UPI0024BC6381|nr:hypothetical protein [Clostridium perfringens]